MSERAWHSSGAYLLNRLPGRGGLEVTADYLRAYFARPELAPIEESCEAEQVAHARLVDDPYLQLSQQELAEFEDADAGQNYKVFLAFRDLLVGIKDAGKGLPGNCAR